MAVVARGGNLSDSGNTKDDVYALIDNATVGSIVNADIATNAAIADTKLATITTASKVSGAALTSLASIPSGAGAIPAANLTNATGTIVQVVNYQTGAVATGSTVIPFDDTIPQNTEGDEYMTLAITPISATNNLKIDVVIHFSTTAAAAQYLTAALFQDTTANALACGAIPQSSGNDTNPYQIKFTHYMTAGTTSETTFKVRAGAGGAGTTTFNGQSGARRYGGVLASSITITEIKV